MGKEARRDRSSAGGRGGIEAAVEGVDTAAGRWAEGQKGGQRRGEVEAAVEGVDTAVERLTDTRRGRNSGGEVRRAET